MNLRDAEIGKAFRITRVGGEGALRQHFLDMGVIPDAIVKIVKYAPLGDPMEILIHGYELTLRLAEAENISVEEADEREELEAEREEIKAFHPGLGEKGKYHNKKEENPLPDSEILVFALVGNQNCGKTTLFNQLTGSNQHVGNFPGVTVERKDGAIRGYPNTKVVDLPGIYSMSPYSSEELISRNFVLEEKPHGIINIVDATNIERNLYLTMQLLEMNIPMVVALNMMDEVTANGGTIDVNNMEALLGVPVIPISAIKNQGVDELVEHAVHVAHFREKPLRQDFCSEEDHGGAVHRAIHSISHLVEDHARKAKMPLRFSVSKIIEGDSITLEKLALEKNEMETIDHIVLQMEQERGLDRSAAIADMRFAFINGVSRETVKKPKESAESIRSRKIDEILTGKYTAIPMFVLIMAAVFYLTFNVIGAWLQGLLEAGVDALSYGIENLMTSWGVNEAIRGLVVEGAIAGVGSVVSFLPIIVVLFLFLSLMEDSGYIARVAFVMDKLLRKIGLSGRSIVPLLVGFGCTVPAVMATRTLPSERDRRMTILLTPFMSCSAKLPIYAFFVSAFFPGKGGLIMTGLYLLGIVVGILVALLYRKTLFKGEAVPFVMELPNYRMPSLKNVIRLLWDKAKDFLERAFTVILVATIVVWILKSFDTHLNLVENPQDSILAMVAGWISPLMEPLGLGDWRISTSLISGIMAKESVVSVIEVLFSRNVAEVITPLAAASLLVFSLLYTPCIAAIAAIKREMGGRWALAAAGWQLLVAWVAAFIVRLIGMAVGL